MAVADNTGLSSFV